VNRSRTVEKWEKTTVVENEQKTEGLF
jgi:hypothetical protein